MIFKVIVLTPDFDANNKGEASANTLIKTLRPEEETTLLNDVMDTINNVIKEQLAKANSKSLDN
jgi:hypothetical protein